MFLNLVKLGDYLGRSLRENVELFSVEDNSVTYLTESNKIVKGKFSKDAKSISEIQIDDASIFEDKRACSLLADKRVSFLLADLLENDLSKAKKSFDGILNIWESKLKFNRIQKNVQQKASNFDESMDILGTPEFQRLLECTNELVKILTENKKYLLSPEVRSSIKLSSIISKSFNMPAIGYEQLSEMETFQIPDQLNSSIYDHLCRQELVAKELNESKLSLDTIWITNDKIQKLPSFIYESDDNIMQLVSEIISEVPYFAMATKKQINSLIEGNMDLLIENSQISNKDIKKFVGKIYEFKKPVKDHLVSVLSEKYGVNIQSLTASPTFSSLAKTEVFIFESLSKMMPKNSNVKRVLKEFADMLSTKTGVELIDVFDVLNEMFDSANYTDSINETSLLNYMNFERVADDLSKIGEVLKMIQAGAAAGALGAMGGGQAMQQGMPAQASMAQEVPEGENQYDSDGEEMPEMEGGDDDDPAAQPAPEDESNPSASMDAEDAADEVADEESMDGEEGEPMPEDEDMGEEEAPEMDREELLNNMKELEELIVSLKSELGAEEDMPEDEEGMEEGDEEEESDEEDMSDIDTGEGDDEVHIDTDSHNDEEEEDGEEEEDEEEDSPKDKGKFPFNKGD
jgi:hypothetical protein